MGKEIVELLLSLEDLLVLVATGKEELGLSDEFAGAGEIALDQEPIAPHHKVWMEIEVLAGYPVAGQASLERLDRFFVLTQIANVLDDLVVELVLVGWPLVAREDE